MNLNQLTAYIGSNVGSQGDLGSIVKEIKTGQKGNANFFTVFLIFDLGNRQIFFGRPEPFTDESVYRYHYFGNNPGASTQYYLARDMKSSGYLLGTVMSDLYLLLKKHQMENRELGGLVKEMEKAGLVVTDEKQGKGYVRLNRLRLFKEVNDYKTIELAEKKTVICKTEDNNEIRYSLEKLARADLGDDNKHNQYALIVPAVKTTDGGIIVMSTHPDYVELAKREKLKSQPAAQDKGTAERVCHLCGQAKNDVKYDYAKKFDPSRINKIFTTTTINTAPYFKKKDYARIYALCNQCYRKLLTGEKEVSERFQGKIANENVFIIPESLLSDFNYQFLGKIKDNVDLAFRRDDADAWLKKIKDEAQLMEQSFYTVNFVFYRTDGRSVTILQVIEDVPTLRFTGIIRTMAEVLEQMQPHLQGMSIGSIYRIIPVKTNKKKEQLDIGRVLTLYKMLLTGGEIKKENLFAYALEALDKGLKQLGKKQLDNYENMILYRYGGGKQDFFIKNIVMSYILLFHICQRFDLLDRNEFMPEEKRGNFMEASFNEKIAGSIERMEQFLDQQGFKKEARALFYLGTLVYRVAVAQYNKEHRTKPVLKKIDFQGMPPRDIHRLYFESIEKLRQYNRFTLFAEALMNRFHYYAGSMEGKWPLSEQANVFYVLAGYAYMVGSKPIDLNLEERAVLEEMEGEDEGNDSQAE